VIAALDIGLKRIGVALSPDGKITLPQNPIIRRNRQEAARNVSRFVGEWNIDMLIVGIPKGSSSEDEMGRRIRHFVSLLEIDKKVKVYYQDEASSSQEAKAHMRGVVRERRDGRIDSMAAAIILQRWLDGNQADGKSEAELI